MRERDREGSIALLCGVVKKEKKRGENSFSSLTVNPF